VFLSEIEASLYKLEDITKYKINVAQRTVAQWAEVAHVFEWRQVILCIKDY